MFEFLNDLFLYLDRFEFSTDLLNWRPLGEYSPDLPRAFFRLKDGV